MKMEDISNLHDTMRLSTVTSRSVCSHSNYRASCQMTVLQTGLRPYQKMVGRNLRSVQTLIRILNLRKRTFAVIFVVLAAKFETVV